MARGSGCSTADLTFLLNQNSIIGEVFSELNILDEVVSPNRNHNSYKSYSLRIVGFSTIIQIIVAQV